MEILIFFALEHCTCDSRLEAAEVPLWLHIDQMLLELAGHGAQLDSSITMLCCTFIWSS
jgi:hypothetical protein